MCLGSFVIAATPGYARIGMAAPAILLAARLLQRTMRPQELESWGWRIPFVIGGLLAVVVFWIRRGLDESASWQARGSEPSRAALLIFMLAQPLMGWISDQVGRKAMLVVAFGLGALVAYPVFAGIARTHASSVALAVSILMRDTQRTSRILEDHAARAEPGPSRRPDAERGGGAR